MTEKTLQEVHNFPWSSQKLTCYSVIKISVTLLSNRGPLAWTRCCKTHLYMSVLQLCSKFPEATVRLESTSTQQREGHDVQHTGTGCDSLWRWWHGVREGTRYTISTMSSRAVSAALPEPAVCQCCWHSCSTMPRLGQCAQTRLSQIWCVWTPGDICMISYVTRYPSYDHFCVVTLLTDIHNQTSYCSWCLVGLWFINKTPKLVCQQYCF